jgi:dTDP-4-amino-4,6-dideoxygalactose transaminase
MDKLALLGGEKAVNIDVKDIFTWPIVNKEMEEAVLSVLRTGNMSGSDITKEFERKFADWHNRKYGLGASSGTAALQTAFYGLGLGRGDEVICPAITYWASCLPLFSLGATVVFADVLPDTHCIDPDDIEKRITPRTKAIIVVHYAGYPAEMDRIMEIAKKHNLKVIEDASHAHGGHYKGKMVGTFGDVACFSLMSGKSFAIGEAGIFITDSREIYERAVAFGWYERHNELTLPGIVEAAGLPWGGYKYRMHQMSSAVGLVQLKKFPAEMEEIDQAMNYFWDNLEGVPGFLAHRPPKGSGSTKGAWYASHALYRPEQLNGLSAARFSEALRAEGFSCNPGCNRALHLHPVFNTLDIYGDGKPTRNAFSDRDLSQLEGSLPVSEGLQSRVLSIVWFKKFYKDIIDCHVKAVKKVVEHHKELLEGDKGNPEGSGNWSLSFRR